MSSNYSISKTSFLKFEQCQKAFFLNKKHPYLRDKLSVDKQLTFKRGHDVGYFARQLFPGGIDASENCKNVLDAATITQQLIEKKQSVIYEATFVFNSVLVMVDILVLNEEHYTAYEIKSSLKVSVNYIKDACLQYYVLKNCLQSVDDFYLVTIDENYQLDIEIEPKKLFKKRSVKQKAEENLSYFTHQIEAAQLLLEQNAIPNIAIGKHCFRPYQCDFFGTCWKDVLTDNSIFNLPLIDRNKLFEWFENGVTTIEQLNDDWIEKENHLKIKKSYLTQQTIINKPKVDEFLNQVKQPIAAMDMELWNPAIPQLKGSSPFQQIPFLVCFYDGEKQEHFFADYQTDAHEQFANELIRLSENYATLVVYDKTMEMAAINNLIKKFPHLIERLEVVKNKLIDLFEIFLNLHYYDPKFKSNFSLKSVSAILLNEVNYDGISSGLEAMNYFNEYRLTENTLEKETIKTKLIDYCTTDCVATLGLLNFLRNQLYMSYN